MTPTEKKQLAALQAGFTDYLILGFRDGRCVASGWKQQGRGAEKENARLVAQWVREGLDIQTLHKDDPKAKAAHDQMWDDARAAVAGTPA